MSHPLSLTPARRRGVAGVLFACLALAVTSCGDGRKTCYPVSGTVTVDGKPAAECMVRFCSSDPADDAGPHRILPVAMTDENGKFKLTTFETGDGAPEGEYTVSITWRAKSGLLKNQFDGPDRLNGKYAVPESSGLKAKIEKKPQELPPFELKTK